MLQEETGVAPLAVEISVACASQANRSRAVGIAAVFQQQKQKAAEIARGFQNRRRSEGPRRPTPREMKLAMYPQNDPAPHTTRRTLWDELHLQGRAGRQTSKKIIDLRHAGLIRAESTLAIHLRTGKIGLADYLYRRHVPGFLSPDCGCHGGRETPAHLFFCPRNEATRGRLLARLPHTDLRRLLHDPRCLAVLTR